MITLIRLCYLLFKLSILAMFYSIAIVWAGVVVLLKVIFSYCYGINKNVCRKK